MTHEPEISMISSKEAFKAMVLFLESIYERTNSDDIGSLLGDMQILDDGNAADPAVADDWNDCVKKVLQRKSDGGPKSKARG